MSSRYNPPLQVAKLVATRRDDAERGPLVWMRSEDIQIRLLVEKELAWVQTPRRKELAEVRVDDELARGMVGLRDIFGAGVSEIVTITKPDLDTPPSRNLA
jgi:anaerobic selenocysteine-containing dehydrogenase